MIKRVPDTLASKSSTPAPLDGDQSTSAGLFARRCPAGEIDHLYRRGPKGLLNHLPCRSGWQEQLGRDLLELVLGHGAGKPPHAQAHELGDGIDLMADHGGDNLLAVLGLAAPPPLAPLLGVIGAGRGSLLRGCYPVKVALDRPQDALEREVQPLIGSPVCRHQRHLEVRALVGQVLQALELVFRRATWTVRRDRHGPRHAADSEL